MCRAVRCKTCGKTTWAGCGRHVDSVKQSVPAGQWCPGHADDKDQSAAPSTGLFAKLFGR